MGVILLDMHREGRGELLEGSQEVLVGVLPSARYYGLIAFLVLRVLTKHLAHTEPLSKTQFRFSYPSLASCVGFCCCSLLQ